MAFTRSTALWARASSMGLSSLVRFRFRPTAGKGMGRQAYTWSQLCRSAAAHSASTCSNVV